MQFGVWQLVVGAVLTSKPTGPLIVEQLVGAPLAALVSYSQGGEIYLLGSPARTYLPIEFFAEGSMNGIDWWVIVVARKKNSATGVVVKHLSRRRERFKK